MMAPLLAAMAGAASRTFSSSKENLMTTFAQAAMVCFAFATLIGMAGCQETSTPAAKQTTPAKPAAPATPPPNKYTEFAAQKIRFQPFCFYGEKFPACDFDQPALVKNLIGPYTISVTYYNAAGQKVTTADKPGRYAAVAEIKHDGRTSRRFATLCRLGGEGTTGATTINPAVLQAAGVDQQVLADFAKDPTLARFLSRPTTQPAQETQKLGFQASYAAVLFDLTQLKQAGKPLPQDTMMRLERQWWVTFKRGFYGYDKLYPNAFICPKPIEGAAAPVIHEGTLAQAGVKSTAVEDIDAACQAWLKEVGVGFNLVAVRHGVAFFNRAYGTQYAGPNKDDPFTTSTAAQTASATKFFAAILLAEFADQGLLKSDDPVEKYVPALRGIQVKRPVTIRDMYLHISGFAEVAGDFNPDLEEIVADMYPGIEVAVNHRYGAISLATGGKIMENISGESIPRLYMKHLIEPMGLTITQADGTSGGAVSTAMDLAKVGQMMLNGGAYGDKRYLKPETIKKMQPIPGHDRWDPPGKEIRWGIGIKQVDSIALSDQAYGHSGASGTALVLDPKYDLVLAMTRFEEGPMSYKEFLKRKDRLFKAVVDSIDVGK